MNVHVYFFGMIAEKVGCRSKPVLVGKSLKTIIAELGLDEIQPLLVAVNQVQTHDLDSIVQDGDEVALMPPFSGG